MTDPKEYYISCFRSPYDGMEITAEQYSILETASIELKNLLFEIDYYPIVMKNVQEFIRYCEKVKQSGDCYSINLNRLFANWVNSFYMWIEYHEKQYNNIFGRLKQEFFDSYLSYKLAYNMRIYTTHNSMPITIKKNNVLTGEIQLLIDITPLIDGTIKIRKKTQDELIEIGIKTIDAFQMTKDFVDQYRKIQKDLWHELQTTLCETLMSVHDIVPITDSSFCNAYVHRESDHASLPIGHQMKYLADKSRETGFDFFSSFHSKLAEKQHG